MRGVSANGYTDGMGTRHPRVQVPRDPALDRAIARARALGRAAEPASQIVHDLALRGIDELEADREASARAAEFLVDLADGRSSLDLDALRDVRDRAWR